LRGGRLELQQFGDFSQCCRFGVDHLQAFGFGGGDEALVGSDEDELVGILTL
jgi:hypothetical protein